MLRMPNPGADMDGFIRIYQELFEALRERATFGLDDVSAVLVGRNLATSSGYMGAEALRRSFNKDRSLDPLYNQSKMYVELYRALGWLHPYQGGALRLRFTYLGAHVAAAKRDPTAIFIESILGMSYPSPILGVRGNHILRPFATILRTMAALDGLLNRDEMIVGPLSLIDDRDRDEFDAMIAELWSAREGWAYLVSKKEAVARELGIKTNTMSNYTRFPLAVMRWTGWVRTERRRNFYGRSIPFEVLTANGRVAEERIESCVDLRGSDVQALPEQTKAAVVRVAFYQMLERAGFEVEPVRDQLADDLALVTPEYGSTRPLLFSPFQELDPEYVGSKFPKVSGTKVEDSPRLKPLDAGSIPSLTSEVSLSTYATNGGVQDGELVSMFTDAAKQAGDSPSQIADYLAERFRESNQGEFYPFIARLFRALGYACEHSRAGVNYQRWDAIIDDPEHAIPIEIKSPGEEEFLSVKAVRQAVENKIVLLSRQCFQTQFDTTSLVVGYNPPNDRSEVASLIADVHKAFGIVIGVVDLRSLLRLVAATLLQGKKHNADELRTLHGIIRVADT